MTKPVKSDRDMTLSTEVLTIFNVLAGILAEITNNSGPYFKWGIFKLWRSAL